MTKIVIDKENEITKLENMLETLTDEKDKQSVRFAINLISGFNEVLSERPQGEWIIDFDRFSCPFCGMTIDDEVHYLYSNKYGFNYCPNCGAVMRKDEVDESNN